MLRFIRNIFNRSNGTAAQASDIAGFLADLGLETDRPELYERALTHGSFVSRQAESNERLEFVGDAVLGAIIADILYHHFPLKNEGKLSKMRSKLVSREALNELGTLLKIPGYLKHRIGEADFNSSNNYIGNAFEALIGAVYLDKGYRFTHRFVSEKIVKPFTDMEELDNEIRDFKSYIIIWAQKNKRDFEYIVDCRDSAPEDERFTARLLIDGEYVARGSGRNKKTAQQYASKEAIEVLGIGE